MTSRGTTPEYNNRYMGDDISGDSGSEVSVDSADTPRADVTMEFNTYSDDGVHYFKTMSQLKAWRRKKMAAAEAARTAAYNRPQNPLERLIGRQEDCEECESGIKAAVYCVDCDEMLCGDCKKDCHLMKSTSHHLMYEYPLQGLNRERFEAAAAEVEAREAAEAKAAQEKAEQEAQAKKRQHELNIERFGWDPDEDVVEDTTPAVCTFPKFRPNQRVLFVAHERTGGSLEVKGRIVPTKEGQIRRTDNGMFWYRVKYVDETYPGDPEHERTELVKESDMEDVDENERRKLMTIVRIIEFHEVKAAWNSWRDDVYAQRYAELREFSAIQIQRLWRGDKDRTRVYEIRMRKRQHNEMVKMRWERRERKRKRARRRLRRQQVARARGITTDGTHFFLTFTQLHAWWEKRKAGAVLFKKILNKHWFQESKRRALRIWKEYLHLQDQQRITEGDHLRNARHSQEQFERMMAIRRAKKMSMIKLRAVTKLSGMKLYVSKVGAIPTSEHEEFKIEGTDRGVLKRLAAAKRLAHRLKKRIRGVPGAQASSSAVPVTEAAAVAPETDDEEEGEAGAGGGVAPPPVPGQRRKQKAELKYWLHLKGKLKPDPLAVGTHVKELVRQGSRTILTTRVNYGDERPELPWHPAVDIRLPKLPYIGAVARVDGTIRIDDIRKYNTFKAAMQGPYDASHWLIKGILCVGAYPEGQADKQSVVVTARSSAVAQLLMSGLNTFVCLMTDDEVVRPSGKPYEDDIRESARAVRTALFAGLSAAEKAYERSSNAAGKAKSYAKKIRLRLEELARKDRGKVRDMKERLARFPNKLNFITFPVPEGDIAPDMHIIHLSENLEQRLRLGEKLYIFSRTGRGRAATLAAVLLARIYGMTAPDVVEYLGRCNEAQARQVLIPPRAKPLPSPEKAEESEEEDEKTGKGKLEPISLASKFRDNAKNSFFGTSFSNFGRKKKKTAAQKAKEAESKKLAKAKAEREARSAAVLDKSYVAVTCTPSTNVQKQQIRRILTHTDPFYDTVAAQHEEGQFNFKVIRRNHGLPAPLPTITLRSEIERREALLKDSNDRRMTPRRLGGVNR